VITINHIALVVSDIDEAQTFWVRALGLPLERVQEIEEEAVKVAFLSAGDSEIELVQPTTEESGVARYMRRRGPGMHHLCLEVPDLEAALARLRTEGMELINETPRLSSSGRQYAFIHPRSTNGVLVELYQRTSRIKDDICH
jgi:methylmalonyl-CoA/ethylmalonyl-CoA epimerase